MILEVDDDSDDREIFLEAVNSINPNISCKQVESGVEALEYLNNADVLPDFIFMDINMPKMTGYECVDVIAANPKMKPVQIIMYSTFFNPVDQKKFSARGIRYLTKTARFSDLIEGIKKITSSEVTELAKSL